MLCRLIEKSTFVLIDSCFVAIAINFDFLLTEQVFKCREHKNVSESVHQDTEIDSQVKYHTEHSEKDYAGSDYDNYLKCSSFWVKGKKCEANNC